MARWRPPVLADTDVAVGNTGLPRVLSQATLVIHLGLLVSRWQHLDTKSDGNLG